MTDGTWYLGIDLGTGSCKAVIVDSQLKVLGIGRGDYISEKTLNWQEQDPDATYAGMVLAVHEAIKRAGVGSDTCAGISLGCALHGVMAVDGEGKPLTPVMTWADNRAVEVAAGFDTPDLKSQIYQITGCPLHWMYWPYKIAWLRENQPEIFVKTSRFISVKEYIFQKLTGEYWIDYPMAAGTGLMDARRLVWSPEMLSLAGIHSEQLSQLCAPQKTFLGILPNAAQELSLSQTTRLVMGASDAVNSSLGAGSLQPDQATCMVGTSGAFRIIAPQPVLDRKARSWCYAIDRQHWLVGGALNNGGVVLTWLQDMLSSAGAKEGSVLSFDQIMQLAQESDVGCEGLICLPLFAGERSPNWDLNARGTFFGLTLQHNLCHIARSLIEGVGFRLMDLDQILADIGIEVRQIRASGGFTQSAFWVQTVADILGKEIQIPVCGETSGVGTALWAVYGDRLFESTRMIAEKLPIDKVYQPDPSNHEKYQQIYVLFRGLYQAVQPFFGKTTALLERFNQQSKEVS
jgi:gluconokinase